MSCYPRMCLSTLSAVSNVSSLGLSFILSVCFSFPTCLRFVSCVSLLSCLCSVFFSYRLTSLPLCPSLPVSISHVSLLSLLHLLQPSLHFPSRLNVFPCCFTVSRVSPSGLRFFLLLSVCACFPFAMSHSIFSNSSLYFLCYLDGICYLLSSISFSHPLHLLFLSTLSTVCLFVIYPTTLFLSLNQLTLYLLSISHLSTFSLVFPNLLYSTVTLYLLSSICSFSLPSCRSLPVPCASLSSLVFSHRRFKGLLTSPLFFMCLVTFFHVCLHFLCFTSVSVASLTGLELPSCVSLPALCRKCWHLSAQCV